MDLRVAGQWQQAVFKGASIGHKRIIPCAPPADVPAVVKSFPAKHATRGRGGRNRGRNRGSGGAHVRSDWHAALAAGEGAAAGTLAAGADGDAVADELVFGTCVGATEWLLQASAKVARHGTASARGTAAVLPYRLALLLCTFDPRNRAGDWTAPSAQQQHPGA